MLQCCPTRENDTIYILNGHKHINHMEEKRHKSLNPGALLEKTTESSHGSRFRSKSAIPSKLSQHVEESNEDDLVELQKRAGILEDAVVEAVQRNKELLQKARELQKLEDRFIEQQNVEVTYQMLLNVCKAIQEADKNIE